MIAFPNAKINLGLRILRKRTDGYHDIDSCFYPVPWQEALEISLSDELSFKSTGIPIDGNSQDNLCLKAYQLLAQDYDLPKMTIHLHKAIPIGAGLGGGSADAAFTLSMINDYAKLGLTDSQLADYAAKLGSDCPFFVYNKPMMVSGRGEVLESFELSLKGWHIVLLYPNLHISTKEAYQGISPKTPEYSCREILSRPVEEWAGLLLNDFEASLFPKYPILQELKETLYAQGAAYASMTGSGSTVFGLFKQSPNWQSWGLEGVQGVGFEL